MAHPNLTTFANRPVLFGIDTGSFQNIFVQFQDWMDRRKTRRALADLSDAQLEDIGLTRGDINHIVRKGLRR